MSADLSGTWRAAVGVGDLHQQFVAPDFDDSAWADVPVPGHWRSTEEFAATDGPVLYRRRFELDDLPAPGARRFLVLDGVFYFGDVWLDAGYLGATDGYFAPHALELDDRTAAAGEHVTAIEVACPRQTDRTAKRMVTGVFSHWDNLDPAWNPGGLWRPVRVETTGPVRIARLRCLCAEANETRGRLLFDLTLDSGTAPDPAPLPARLDVRIHAPDGALLAEHRRDLSLAAGENHLSFGVDVDEPPRWWPWRLAPIFGVPPALCDVEVSVEVDGAPSDQRALRTAFREIRMRNWELTVNGERMFAMGSNQGPTRMQLGEASADEFARDVRLAVDANLDLLRVHAHVSRPELYDAADEAGLLLWQDFPLQWGYGRGIRGAAVRQAREMVDLLGHHPSVALWCAHNEPLAVDVQPGEPMRPGKVARIAASMFLPSWNKDVLDRSLARALHKADPTRPVNRHSGVFPGVGSRGTDAHFYFGWYHGKLDGLAPALRAVPSLARFVTEFGAQAVPEHAAFMEPARWPDLDWERLLEHHACQKMFFDRTVPPADFATFDEWRAATQAYQAALIQLQVEDLRRLKYGPTGGFCHFCFADGHRAVTWSVLDHERAPKLGYEALRDSCRSALAMVDPRTGALHIVSELRHGLSDAVVTVHAGADRLGTWTGYVPPDGLAFVAWLDLPPPEHWKEADADDGLVVTLEHPEIGRVEHRYPALLLASVRQVNGE